MNLSNGAMVEILNGLTPEKPILQVINAKKISAGNTTDRYRLLLSDGDHTYSYAMLAAQMNKVMESRELHNYSVIELNKYMCNTIGEKKVIILLDFTIIANDVGQKIGEPASMIPPISEVRSVNKSSPAVNSVGQKGALLQKFDLCVSRYNNKSLIHKMSKLGFGLGGAGSSDKESIQRCISALVHACQCRNADCHMDACLKMKRVVSHAVNCKRKMQNACPKCKQLIALCCYHAKHCTADTCQVLFCPLVKKKLRSMQLRRTAHQPVARILDHSDVNNEEADRA